MGKIQFEVRLLVEVDVPERLSNPITLADVNEKMVFIDTMALKLLHGNPSFQSLIGVKETFRGLKSYTEFISDLTTEAYKNIFCLMQQMGCMEFDFKSNGVEELPQVTYTDGYPTKAKCVKIILDHNNLSFECDDGNSYSIDELDDEVSFKFSMLFWKG